MPINIIFSYIFYFIAASASPLQRRWLAKNKDHNINPRCQIAFAFHTMIFLVLGSLFFQFFEPIYIIGPIYYLVGFSLICGVFGALHFIFSYTAQRHVDAGVSSLVSNIYTPITIILSIIFLKEGLTNLQIFGTILLLFSMFIVAKKHRISRFRFDKYFLMILMSGVMLGVLLVTERAMIKITGYTLGIMLSWFAQFAVLGLVTLFTKSRHTYTNNDVAITGSLKFLQGLSWTTLVFVVGNLSVVSSITTFKIVIMFIAGALFLNEKEDFKRKFIGSIIAVIGLLMMK
jgi:uncharacterized membrane protein